MGYMRERRLLVGTPTEFVRNRLIVIVPRANPARIARLQDLANPGVKVVLAADAVPVGRYSREALQKLSRAPAFPVDFAQRVLRNAVSEEENVRGVVTKVQLGEADAGMVYRSDVAPPTAGQLQVIDIPDRYNVVASYPIARVRGGANPEAGASFINVVLSPLGQRVLHDHNFVPVTSP
jgi:molybdate transport system substrate-binding protein